MTVKQKIQKTNPEPDSKAVKTRTEITGWVWTQLHTWLNWNLWPRSKVRSGSGEFLSDADGLAESQTRFLSQGGRASLRDGETWEIWSDINSGRFWLNSPDIFVTVQKWTWKSKSFKLAGKRIQRPNPWWESDQRESLHQDTGEEMKRKIMVSVILMPGRM